MEALKKIKNENEKNNRKLKLKADVEALGAPPSPGVLSAEPPSPLVRRIQGQVYREHIL